MIMMNRFVPLGALALLASACSFTPHYDRPTSPVPAAFKEQPPFRLAQPSDALARGRWWAMFGDPQLDALEDRAAAANQTIAQAAAAYDVATALVREQRANLFPTASGSAGYTRSGTGATSNAAGGTATRSGSRFSLGLQASWAPDLFGAVRTAVSNARASQQASAGDLANARLAVQGEVATNYLQLRALDAQSALYAETVTAYARDLEITRNRYKAGVAGKSDVLQAQTQLLAAQTTAADLLRQRGVLEHAIAVLVGDAPANFSLAVAPDWRAVTPAVPATLPSDLLERRPDIAAAERRVAAANAQIGVQRAAFFPALSLSASTGQQAGTLADLFTSGANVWSLGANLVETLFDGGARSARVAQARASWRQAVGVYRQTVLTAFGQVEDNLLGVRQYADEASLATQSAAAATEAEAIARNQYKAGTADYTAVVVAETAALAARRTAIQTQASRQAAIVALVQAIGGGWNPAEIDRPKLPPPLP